MLVRSSPRLFTLNGRPHLFYERQKKIQIKNQNKNIIKMEITNITCFVGF